MYDDEHEPQNTEKQKDVEKTKDQKVNNFWVLKVSRVLIQSQKESAWFSFGVIER